MIVVSGGATGLGRAIAAHFVERGSEVIITGRRGDALAATADEIGATPLRCDHSNPTDLRNLAERCARIEVLVNNAGGNPWLLESAPPDLEGLASEWLGNFQSNVLTAVLTVAALGDHIVDGGRIISIGSIAAERGLGSYGSAKAALSSWTVGLSRSFGPRSITANVVAPGYVEGTDFFGEGGASDDRREVHRAATAVGRVGRPADVVALVDFLASDRSSWITGQTLHVNGGAFATR